MTSLHGKKESKKCRQTENTDERERETERRARKQDKNREIDREYF